MFGGGFGSQPSAFGNTQQNMFGQQQQQQQQQAAPSFGSGLFFLINSHPIIAFGATPQPAQPTSGFGGFGQPQQPVGNSAFGAPQSGILFEKENVVIFFRIWSDNLGIWSSLYRFIRSNCCYS